MPLFTPFSVKVEKMTEQKKVLSPTNPWHEAVREIKKFKSEYFRLQTEDSLFSWEVAVNNAEAYINDPKQIKSNIKDPEKKQSKLDKIKIQRDFIKANRIAIEPEREKIALEEESWQAMFLAVSDCAIAFSMFRTRESLNRLELAINDAETYLMNSSEVIFGIRDISKHEDILNEMRKRREFIDANREMIAHEKAKFDRLNVKKSPFLGWEASFRVVSECAMAFSKLRTKLSLNKLEHAINAAEAYIMNPREAVFGIGDIYKRQAVLNEIQEQHEFIAANRDMIAAEKAKFDLENAKKTKWYSFFCKSSDKLAAVKKTLRSECAPLAVTVKL